DPATDHRTDIYSFGCVAYEMLAGGPPFAGPTPHQFLLAHLRDTPQPIAERRRDCPASRAPLVMRCLEKHPAQRPQSATEPRPARRRCAGVVEGARRGIGGGGDGAGRGWTAADRRATRER